MSRRTFALLHTVTAGTLLLSSSSIGLADTIVFQDHFTNGVPANSDGVPVLGTGFWDTSAGTSTESSGYLTLNATTPGGTMPTTSLACYPKVDHTFNFFKAQQTYAIQFGPSPAISGTETIGGTNTKYANIFTFAVATKDAIHPTWGMTNWYADDVIWFSASQSGQISLSLKVNHSETLSPSYVAPLVSGINIGSLINTVTGVSLTLSGTSYDLKLLVPVGSGIASDGMIDSNDAGYSSFHGVLSLNVSDWGSGGDSGIYMGVQRSYGASDPAGSYAQVILDSLTVTTIPEPASLGLMALGLWQIVGRRRA